MKTGRRPLSILVIDDLKPLAAVLEIGLSKLGQKVLTAFSGADGISLFESNSVDVIICDLELEDLTGWDVASRIKLICSRTNAPKPPFILLTGWLSAFIDEQCPNEKGVDLILTKPIEINRLMEIVEKVILTKS